MPTIDDLKKSNYVSKRDVEPPILVTITGYQEVNVALEGYEPDLRWALTFRELEKPFVLNSTNGQIIAAITGSGDLNDWKGKQIVLYNDPNVSFRGKLTGGIRCRAPRHQTEPDAPEPKHSELPTTFDDGAPF